MINTINSFFNKISHSFQYTHTKETPKEIDPLSQEKQKIYKKWASLQLDASVLKTDYESARFLIEERLIFPIVGLQNTSAAGKEHNPLEIRNGKLFIRSKEKFIPVKSLINRIQYNPTFLQWVDVTTNLPWLVTLQQGLIQKDRSGPTPLLPVTRLSRKEQKSLLTHACSFTGARFSKNHPARCVLQIVTNPQKTTSSERIKALFPTHVFFRVIDQNGTVYSTGAAAASVKDNKFWTGPRKNLVSINGAPTTIDFEEFRPHGGRRVTSIPMTIETCDRVLAEINKMRKETFRFNYFKQNCSNIAMKILKIAGVSFNNRLSIYTLLSKVLPTSPLHNIVDRICFLSHKLSMKTLLPSLDECYWLASRCIYILTTPFRLITNLAFNILFLTQGANKGTAIKKNLYKVSSDPSLQYFSTLIHSFKDMFKTPIIPHSSPIIAWQNEQKSTLFYPYKKPDMNILPEEGILVSEKEKRPYIPYGTFSKSSHRREDLYKRRNAFFSKLLFHK